MRFLKALIILALSLALVSCGGRQRRLDRQRNYLPVVSAALASGSLTMSYMGPKYSMNGDWKGCIAATALRSAFETASIAIMDPGAVIPGVMVDVSGCLEQNPDFELELMSTSEEELSSLVVGMSTAVLGTAELYISFMEGGNCESREVAEAAISYVRYAVEPVVMEILNPDGFILIPDRIIDRASCPHSEE